MLPEYLQEVHNSFADEDGVTLILNATSGAGEVGLQFVSVCIFIIYRVSMSAESTVSSTTEFQPRSQSRPNVMVEAGVAPTRRPFASIWSSRGSLTWILARFP
jgi:hypothetical protein